MTPKTGLSSQNNHTQKNWTFKPNKIGTSATIGDKTHGTLHISDQFFRYRGPFPLFNVDSKYLHDRTHESLLSSQNYNIEQGEGRGGGSKTLVKLLSGRNFQNIGGARSVPPLSFLPNCRLTNLYPNAHEAQPTGLRYTHHRL